MSRRATERILETRALKTIPKLYGRRMFFLVIGMGLWAWAWWGIRAYGTKRTIVCDHSALAGITCRETASWFGRFPLGQEKIMRAVHAAEIELSCYTDGTNDDHTCSYDTVRVFTPDESFILFQRLPEPEARAAATRINDFINRDSHETALIFEDFNAFQAWLGLICVPLPALIVGGWALWMALLGLRTSDQQC